MKLVNMETFASRITEVAAPPAIIPVPLLFTAESEMLISAFPVAASASNPYCVLPFISLLWMIGRVKSASSIPALAFCLNLELATLTCTNVPVAFT